ncbi:MAG: FeoA family protein [bacterium]
MTKIGFPLDQVRKGSQVIIVELPQDKHQAKLIRLGLHKGQTIKCLEKLPGGTIIIQKSRQEIALGVSLARTILVAYTHTEHR